MADQAAVCPHTHTPPLNPSIPPFNKRVNDVCALISNQLFFILILFKLGQIFRGPHGRLCVSISAAVPHYNMEPLTLSREIISGRLILTRSRLG